MTTPTILASHLLGTAADFRNTKVQRNGVVQQKYITTTIASGTVIATVVGLFAFQKGFSLNQAGTQLHINDCGDGSFTFNLGYVYDDHSTYTNDDDAFASALTTGQAGGLITFDEHAGLSWQAAAPGYLVLTTAGSTTDASGTVKGQIAFTYDGL